MTIPIIIKILITISEGLTFLLKMSGSRKDVNKVDKVIHTTPIDMVLILIAKKKENQCKAMIPPILNKVNISFLESSRLFFKNKPIINRDAAAMPVR